jgi:hypothetical protein
LQAQARASAFADFVHADTMRAIGYSRISCGLLLLLVF